MNGNMRILEDGWANLITGMGNALRDRRVNTYYEPSLALGETELNSIYRADGIGTRIIDVVVEDMTREWFRVTGDTDNGIQTELKRIRARKQLTRALRWASLHGGALVVVGTSDGQRLDQPLDESKLRRLTFLHVYDRWRVTVNDEDLNRDPNSPKFRQPEIYRITPVGAAEFRVHESRTLRFEGRDVTDSVRALNNGWGDSDLMVVYERLRGLGEAYNGIEHILGEFVLSFMRIQNLQGLIANGKESVIRARLNLIDMTKHFLNTVLLDENETYERAAAPVAGLAEIMDKLVQLLSAITGIPVTVLMGESPAGLNATGASDIRRYYDMIASRQEERLLPPLERLLRLIMLSSEGPTGGKEIENWKVEFNPLWQPTDREIAEIRGMQAKTDETYISTGVLSAEEVRESRFGGEQYSLDTRIEGAVESREPPEPEPEEEIQQTSGR